jgi:hypothetical protein
MEHVNAGHARMITSVKVPLKPINCWKNNIFAAHSTEVIPWGKKKLGRNV